jgi:hypothetical protein
MLPAPSQPHVTQHARSRAQQRGVSHATIETILTFADREIVVGGGLRSRFVSRARLRRLAGIVLPPSECERADGVVLVIDEGENTVISVVKPRGRRGQRYFKPSKRPARQHQFQFEFGAETFHV